MVINLNALLLVGIIYLSWKYRISTKFTCRSKCQTSRTDEAIRCLVKPLPAAELMVVLTTPACVGSGGQGLQGAEVRLNRPQGRGSGTGGRSAQGGGVMESFRTHLVSWAR